MSYEDRRPQTPPRPEGKRSHTLTMENRRRLAISGVEEVESFDEQQIVMLTSEGSLILRGEDLSISKLSVENGDVTVQGLVSELCYEEPAPARGLWQRLFH